MNRGRYQEIYVKTGNEVGLIEYLEKIELACGFLLWEVKASYANTLRPTTYYVAAKTAREARTIFKKRYSWLNRISSVGLPSSVDSEFALNNPTKRLII